MCVRQRRFNKVDGQSSLRVVCLIDRLVEGMTLIGASHLILTEPSYSPLTETQKMGRVHRPGQTKVCWVYRLITCGSFEETIMVCPPSPLCVSMPTLASHGDAPHILSLLVSSWCRSDSWTSPACS